MDNENRRREHRNPPRQAELINVAVRQELGKATEPMSAELCDISRGGAKLRLPRPLKLNENASVLLASKNLGLDLQLSASVCWVCRDDGQWSLGFEFNPRMPSCVLETLLANGVVERRGARRQEKRIPVTARWESNPTDHPAVLWDISPGGFCILSPEKATRKVRISPQHAQQMFVAGATQWEFHMAGGYVVGCKFIDDDGFKLLQSLDAAEDSGDGENDHAAEGRPAGKTILRGLVDFFKRSDFPDFN